MRAVVPNKKRPFNFDEEFCLCLTLLMCFMFVTNAVSAAEGIRRRNVYIHTYIVT